MAITRTNMIDDDGSGTTGTIINNAWKQEFYGQIDAFADGVWVDIPYNAANFSVVAGSGTWTVAASSTVAKVIVNQKTTVVAFTLPATITGSPTILKIIVPGLGTLARQFGTTFHWKGDSGAAAGYLEVSPGHNGLILLRDLGGTPWMADANLYLVGQTIISTT
jgi:hypothetical protein